VAAPIWIEVNLVGAVIAAVPQGASVITASRIRPVVRDWRVPMVVRYCALVI